MTRAYEHTKSPQLDWQEALPLSFDHGLTNLFNIEWLVEKVERGEWSGLWW
ncbi:MAG: hypothetical protein AAGD04_09875 [Pseudomonadota bacterium]